MKKFYDLIKQWTLSAQNSSNNDDERAIYYKCAEQLHSLILNEPDHEEIECWECLHENDGAVCGGCLGDPALTIFGRRNCFERKDHK